MHKYRANLKDQKELHRIGELSVEDSVNRTELVNMVSEGIQQVLQQGPSPHQDTANLENKNNEMKEKVADMEQKFNQM
eukprot:3649787-Ditylum_brightwellii.AAC.1